VIGNFQLLERGTKKFQSLYVVIESWQIEFFGVAQTFGNEDIKIYELIK